MGVGLQEGYGLAMHAVDDIQSLGCRVEKTPSRSRNIQSTLDKYRDMPGRVPPGMWFHVTFHTEDPEILKSIQAKAKHLGWRGICFDTGGCQGERDWELDWSFHVVDTPDGEQEMARDEVEDMIQGLPKEVS